MTSIIGKLCSTGSDEVCPNVYAANGQDSSSVFTYGADGGPPTDGSVLLAFFVIDPSAGVMLSGHERILIFYLGDSSGGAVNWIPSSGQTQIGSTLPAGWRRVAWSN